MDVSLTDFAARLAPAGTLAIEWTGVVLSLLVLVFLLVSLVLILVVLIQRPQGGGLSAAFGAGGGGQTAFGSKTGDALTLFTIGAFV
ncbi:MAG: preprotein translocase subunit SecG, partial [Planctomycetota bacterium]